LNDVLAHLDLGGRLDSERIQEIKEAATEMWSAFAPREEGLKFGSIEDLKDRTGGALLAYELRQGVQVPCSIECSYFSCCLSFFMSWPFFRISSLAYMNTLANKLIVYFPVRYHFSSDFTLARRIDEFLVLKMGRQEGWYLDMMKRYCTHRGLDERTGIQTFIGGTVRRGVWDLTVYIGPEGYAPERGNGMIF